MRGIRRAIVEGTDIRYRDPAMQFLADIKVETVRAADTKFENDIRSSGDGTVRGKPFRIVEIVEKAEQMLQDKS